MADAAPTTTPILDSIHASYRGRLPKRADGKLRRQKILDAVRQIIIQQGAQGVKHRAIAELAEVPLAATTYYFPDLAALLHDAFLHFCETNLNQLQRLESAGRELLAAFQGNKRLSEEDFQTIRARLTSLVFEHIREQVQQSDDRIIERAFRNESLRNLELAKLVNAMEMQQLNAIAYFLGNLGSEHPLSDSREVLAVILFLERSLLTKLITEKQALQTVTRLFNRLI